MALKAGRVIDYLNDYGQVPTRSIDRDAVYRLADDIADALNQYADDALASDLIALAVRYTTLAATLQLDIPPFDQVYDDLLEEAFE